MKFRNDGERRYNEAVAEAEDEYSRRCYTYGKDWAELMEPRIESGEKLEDIAEETSHEADTDGITGFMYGIAVSMLSDIWEHGDELRLWHNRKYGVPDEVEGTVNPAIIVIDTSTPEPDESN